jgi:hypothetical protein
MCEVCIRANQISAELDKTSIPADRLTAKAMLVIAIDLLKAEITKSLEQVTKKAQDAHFN